MLERIFKKHTARIRIAMGLSGMLVSLMLLAAIAGLVPDRHGAIRDGHARLAEAIAVNSSIFVTTTDIRRMKASLEVIVERNDEILSAAVRRLDGTSLVEIGDHVKKWTVIEEGKSSNSQVVVPIFEGADEWGRVELRFEPLLPQTWYGSLLHPVYLLIGFISFTSFILFYWYLGKMLKQLDPSQAVPERVRSALDTMAEGLLVIDAGQNVVLANQAFSELAKESPDSLTGRQITRFPWFDRDNQPLEKKSAPWSKALADGTLRTADMVRLHIEGESNRTFMVNCSPILAGGSKPAGVLISFDDVTELEQKEIELRISRDEAEKANRSKSEFLANMSHEIRTPMNAILGFSEVLKRGYDRDSKDSIRYLNTITSSGNHLLELINDILDLSKVESGRVEVEIIDTPVHQVVHEVLQIMQVKADEKEIYLKYEPAGPLPEYIHSDAGKLRQILTNLVGNAIKFTSSGGVRIVTRLQERGSDAVLYIDVIDTGIGMTPQQAVDVFKPFTQADSSITRRFGGTGLGLTISKRFAEALGGDIVVTSQPDQGSQFTVSVDPGPIAGLRHLSVDELQSILWQEATDETTVWEFPESTVLVVDDGEENRELLKVVLDDIGVSVVTAENGQVALDFLANQDFDLVLMDVQMPVMDGYTAVGLMRDRNDTTPVIALTADAMEGAEQKCLDAGYSEYMTKPIDIDRLMDRLAKHLDGQPLRDGESAATRRVDDEASTNDQAEAAEKIVSSLPMSNPKFRIIVEKFIARLDEQLAAIDAAWAERDYEQLKKLGHWLKGSSGSVGFGQFVEPARELEQFSVNRDDANIEKAIRELNSMHSRISLEADPGEQTVVQMIRPANAEQVDESAPSQNRAAEEPAGNSQTNEQEPVTCRLSLSNPKIRSIAEKFKGKLSEQIAAIDTAWKDRNYAELDRLGHWLKGSAGTIGFDQFVAPAKELEQFARDEDDAKLPAAIQQLHSLHDRLSIESKPEPGVVIEMTKPAKDYDIPEQLTSIYVEHNPRLKPIIGKFVTQLSENTEIVEAAVAQEDFDKIEKFGYWLKASGGSLGFAAFVEPARDLQNYAREKQLSDIRSTMGVIKQLNSRLKTEEE